MTVRVYLSNLSPLWPFSRQEQSLRIAIPSYPKGVTFFRDDVDAKGRRGRSVALLVGRDALLRPTSRARPEDIYVASLAVFAWTAEDLLQCLTLAASRGATIHVLDAALDIPPSPMAETLHKAAQAFADAKKRQTGHRTGVIGGKASALRKSEAAKLAAEKIRERWGLPSEQYPTDALLLEAGISRNTAKLYLGKRTDAQRTKVAAMKRAETAYFKRGKARNV